MVSNRLKKGFLYRAVFAFGALAVLSPIGVFTTFTSEALAVTCIGCHTEPAYEKADAKRLKQCLRCHGIGEHPYKKEVLEEEAAAEGRGYGWASLAHAGDAPVPGALRGPVKPVREASLNVKGPDLTEMVYIPEGEFLMGSDDRLRDEKPAHVVYINAFYIDPFEVTKADYRAFVVDTGRRPPQEWTGDRYPEGKGKHPVTYVSWYDAYDYCKWAGKRLPREREWEKGARGTDGRTYPWGNEWDLTKSNSPLRGIEATLPVGSFERGKNQFNIYDMSGNVWEWVDQGYASHPGSDYINPEFGRNYALLKGGSWWDCMFYGCGISAPTFNRAFFDPTTTSDSYGFRCAADITGITGTNGAGDSKGKAAQK